MIGLVSWRYGVADWKNEAFRWLALVDELGRYTYIHYRCMYYEGELYSHGYVIHVR